MTGRQQIADFTALVIYASRRQQQIPFKYIMVKVNKILIFAADYLEVEERLIEKLNPTSLCENFVQNVK